MKFEEVTHFVDSEIVKAMVHKESYGFNTFASNRIGEIEQTTCPNGWQWIPGKPWINVADVTTRGCKLEELNNDLWQSGPDFLKLPEKEWPSVKHPRNDISLPEMKQKFIGASSVECSESEKSLLDRFDLNRFSKWRLLVNTTARVYLLYKRFKQGGDRQAEHTVVDIKEAELLWI